MTQMIIDVMILVATILYAVAITYTSRQLYRSRKESSKEPYTTTTQVWFKDQLKEVRQQFYIYEDRLRYLDRIHTDEINQLRNEMKKISNDTIDEVSKRLQAFYDRNK